MTPGNSNFAWYHFKGQPEQLRIGPAGHGNAQWVQLELVATEEARRVNAFYMEHEARCVLFRHGLRLGFDMKDQTPGVIYHLNFKYDFPKPKQTA